MKPLIVRVTDKLKVLNKTTSQIIALLKVNKDNFTGDNAHLLLYASTLVKEHFVDHDVLVVHLDDGMRIAFVKEHVNKPGPDNLIRIKHYNLTFNYEDKNDTKGSN